MTNRKLKIATGIGVLLATSIWLGMSGIEDGKSYYVTCDEFAKLDLKRQQRRTRLMGSVTAGSIERAPGRRAFRLNLNGASVPVVYRGSDPVPDTFKDGVSALVEGTG